MNQHRTQWQVTYWRDLPTMVAARAGEETVKTQLAARFQEAVDEAAMRLGDVAAEDYLNGWRRSDWAETSDSPAQAVERIAAELDAAWPQETLDTYLDSLGGAQ